METKHAQLCLECEKRKVVRGLHKYSHHERADRAASHRLYHRQKAAVGEFFYFHPENPDVCFPTRTAAPKLTLIDRRPPNGNLHR